MFDVLKLKIATKFMKTRINKLIEKKLYEKFNVIASVDFNDIDIETLDDDIKFHIDVDAKMNKSEFIRHIDNII